MKVEDEPILLILQKSFNRTINSFSESEYLIREKKHHLDSSLYRGNHRITFTLCIQERKEIFIDGSIVKIFQAALLRALEAHKCEALVYLFMPDHFHILVRGKESGSDMRKMILYFKQLTGYWMSKNIPGVVWQKDFYDHLLRKEEDLNKQVRYILLNPVRKEIVDKWSSYPFKGSTVYDFEKWAADRSDF